MTEYTHSTIGGWVGDKRNGKSESLAAAIVWKLLSGEKVWSNMHVKTSPAILARHSFRDGSTIKYTESLPLNFDKFYMLDESISEGTVALDEITYYDPSRGSMSTGNKLINTCVRQAGHRNLDVLFTAKSFSRLDSYLRDETDFIVECSDLKFSPWGKANKVKGGTVIRQRYYDLSGAITGRSTDYFSPYRKPYKVILFYGTPYWNCYNTKDIVPLEEAFTSVRLDLRKRVISNHGDDDNLGEKVYEALSELAISNDEVPSGMLWAFLKSKGIEGTPNTLGRYIPRNVTRRATRNEGVLYNLSGV